jgi:hypothetical protein
MTKTDNKELEKLTDITKWKPTPGMQLWLNTAIQLESDSVSEIATECKMSRTAWYDWLKDDNFLKWWREEWNKRLAGHAWKLDAIGMKNSKRDFNYWKTMQERVGNISDKPGSLQQFNVNGEMTLEFE